MATALALLIPEFITQERSIRSGILESCTLRLVNHLPDIKV